MTVLEILYQNLYYIYQRIANSSNEKEHGMFNVYLDLWAWIYSVCQQFFVGK